jgi:hypothetical protein
MAKQYGVTLTIVLWSTILLPENAWAYLDPGAGSALLQGILGGIAAIGVVLKLYWHRILKFLGLRKTTIMDDDFETDSSSLNKSNKTIVKDESKSD